jgi:protein translocase SecG subunit
MFFVFADIDMIGWADAILTVLAILVAILMTFFILLQEGKGGGLAALGGTKAAGVEGVTNPIRKATGYLAAMFFIMIIILGALHKPKDSVLGAGDGKNTSSKEDKAKADDKAKTDATEEPKAPAGVEAVVPIPPVENKTDAAKPASDAKPATDTKAADSKAADAKPADAKSADTKSADAKPAEKPADAPKVDATKTDATKAAPKPDEAKKPDGK